MEIKYESLSELNAAARVRHAEGAFLFDSLDMRLRQFGYIVGRTEEEDYLYVNLTSLTSEELLTLQSGGSLADPSVCNTDPSDDLYDLMGTEPVSGDLPEGMWDAGIDSDVYDFMDLLIEGERQSDLLAVDLPSSDQMKEYVAVIETVLGSPPNTVAGSPFTFSWEVGDYTVNTTHLGVTIHDPLGLQQSCNWGDPNLSTWVSLNVLQPE